jgi:hypothetical protein
MPSVTLDLIDQRVQDTYNGSGYTETASGTIKAGVEATGTFNSVLSFDILGLPGGATIDSVILNLYGKSVEVDGYEILYVGAVPNTNNLAAQNISSLISSITGFVQIDTASTNSSGIVISGTDTTYNLDITTTYNAYSRETYLIVAIQSTGGYTVGGLSEARVEFDGLLDTNPPTITVNYTIEEEPEPETPTHSTITVQTDLTAGNKIIATLLSKADVLTTFDPIIGTTDASGDASIELPLLDTLNDGVPQFTEAKYLIAVLDLTTRAYAEQIVDAEDGNQTITFSEVE